MAKRGKAKGSAVVEIPMYKPPSPAQIIEAESGYAAEHAVRETPEFKRKVKEISGAMATAGKRALKQAGGLRNVRSA